MLKYLAILFFLTALGCIAQNNVPARIDSLLSDAQYEKAQQLLATQLKGSIDGRATALLLNKVAEINILQGKLRDAEAMLKSINTQGDPFLEAITQSNLGFLYLNNARNDLALENLNSALVKFQNAGFRDTREGARCLAFLTTLYWSTGKFNQAEENGLIALQIRQNLFGENSEEVAASYNDLGLVYGQTDADKALSFYEKALGIYEKAHGKEHPKIAIASNNIGAMYRQLELYGDAVNNFETALAIWRKFYPDGHPNEAAALVNLGRTYTRMGNSASALQYYDKALLIYRKAYGEKHPDISSVLNLKAFLELDDNKFEQALATLQQSIIANVPSFNSTAIASNPRVGEYYNGKVLLYSLRLKAKALEAKHYGKTLKLEDLKFAISCLSSCDTLIDNIRHQSSDESDKIEVGESANEVYVDGVRIAHAMSEISLNNDHYREVAFYFAEKSKSAVLQESIADAEAKSFSGIPSDLLDQEKNLRSTIAFLAQKLSQKPPIEEEKYLRDALFSSNQEYNDFTRKLENDYPNYFNLKFNQSSPTVNDLQELLDEHTAIISYFIDDAGKRIYQFIITKKRFTIANLTLPDNFIKYTKGLRNCLLFNQMDTYSMVSNSLSKVLLPAVPASIHDLIIIPSGRLSTLPFETLYYKKNKSIDIKSMPLLLRKYAIGYEFSAGLLVQKAKTSAIPYDLSIFLCAPITFPSRDNIPELPGTETEVNNIAKLFDGRSTSVVKYKDANEDFIKSGALSKYSFLHFATHGIVDETYPELSRVYFQEGKQDDGNLFAGEIYNLKLNAELTVLSACQTGLGKFSKGEGVIGLSRALVYAGSRNIMVSFWSVSDASTVQLMTDFYKNLLASPTQNFRQTLQRSKISMIDGGKYSSPFYWAPFVLIGN